MPFKTVIQIYIFGPKYWQQIFEINKITFNKNKTINNTTNNYNKTVNKGGGKGKKGAAE